MATVPVTKVMFQGNNLYQVNITGVFDTADATNYVVIDRSTLIGPDGVNIADKLRVDEITWSVSAGFEAVTLSWDFGTDEIIEHLSGQGYMDFRPSGGKVPAGTPATVTEGDILLTTLGGATAADTFSIYLNLRLKQ